MWTNGPDAFDSLSGVSKQNRNPDDLIRAEVFDEIDALLDAPDVKHCNDLRNKFVAHAATAHSRAAVGIAGFAITLDQIAAAQRSLVVANQRIRRDLLWDGASGPVPTPQFDQFAHLDRPYIPADRIQAIHDWWQKHAADREARLK